MLDFEKASMNAFTLVFDQFPLVNCFFLLCQNVQRLIKKCAAPCIFNIALTFKWALHSCSALFYFVGG